MALLPPNGLRQPRAGGLARWLKIGKALEYITTWKIAPIPASRLHALLGRAALILRSSHLKKVIRCLVVDSV
jgi:hypothetical protein